MFSFLSFCFLGTKWRVWVFPLFEWETYFTIIENPRIIWRLKNRFQIWAKAEADIRLWRMTFRLSHFFIVLIRRAAKKIIVLHQTHINLITSKYHTNGLTEHWKFLAKFSQPKPHQPYTIFLIVSVSENHCYVQVTKKIRRGKTPNKYKRKTLLD